MMMPPPETLVQGTARNPWAVIAGKETTPVPVPPKGVGTGTPNGVCAFDSDEPRVVPIPVDMVFVAAYGRIALLVILQY